MLRIAKPPRSRQSAAPAWPSGHSLRRGICRPGHGGYLASLRALSWSVDRLDLLDGDLLIEAERLHGEEKRVMYRFALIGGAQTLLQGRVAVVLDVVAH